MHQPEQNSSHFYIPSSLMRQQVVTFPWEFTSIASPSSLTIWNSFWQFVQCRIILSSVSYSLSINFMEVSLHSYQHGYLSLLYLSFPSFRDDTKLLVISKKLIKKSNKNMVYIIFFFHFLDALELSSACHNIIDIFHISLIPLLDIETLI